MYKQLVFAKPSTFSKYTVSNLFDVQEVLNNERTCILENDDVALSIDKKVIRVFIYDARNKKLQKSIEDYFYG